MGRFIAMMVAAASLLLAGCNTVQGIGKDIKKGGEAIERVGR